MSSVHDFQDNEIIMDSIYGIVKISPFEKRMLSTPEMQRLRRIKQLGFVNLVYPGAEHSRFVHSIGVCHQAKRLIDQINLNFRRQKRYCSWRIEGKNNKNGVQNSSNSLISSAEKVITSVAALLHDLPHSPFSHEIEVLTSDGNKGIPSHDDFMNNPALFKYLFDTENSELAKVIWIFNSAFWELLKSEQDMNWVGKIEERWPKLISEDGILTVNATKKTDCINFPIEGHEKSSIKALPILGVMIFELHLFSKPAHWVEVKDDKFTKDEPEGLKVNTDWENRDNTLTWKPLYGWFRPYRKDIISNTICADLIDYIERDGKNTGILSQLDLKFLDRMTITRAYYSSEGATDLGIKWDDIPLHCEHVVFDIYDHKRGFVRQSIITEILSCLHSRYLLGERVYNHRVVEGARSMLQEVSRLLVTAGVLTPKKLHTCDHSLNIVPTGDETFLAWVLNIADDENEDIKKAKKLVELIQDRRIYREAVIIDGIHGFEHPGSMAGAEANCSSLVKALISDNKRFPVINEISNILIDAAPNDVNNESMIKDLNLLTTVGIREFGKRYKTPNVLIAKPLRERDRGNYMPLEIQPLFACQDPPHIKDQLDAMKNAYDSLWRVYLFIHPLFHHKEHENLHNKIEDIFLKYVNRETGIKWHNSVDLTQLLSDEPLDIAMFIAQSKTVETGSPAEEVISPELKDMLGKVFYPSFKRVYDPVSEGKEPLEGDLDEFIGLISESKDVVEFLSDKRNHSSVIKKINKWTPNPEKVIAARDSGQSIKFILNHIKKIVSEIKKETPKKRKKYSKEDDGSEQLDL